VNPPVVADAHAKRSASLPSVGKGSARSRSGTLAIPLQRKCACGGSCSACSASPSDQLAPPSVHAALRSPSSTLGQELVRQYGGGAKSVQVHTGADAAGSANELHADAYTVGRHIVFAAGRFAPSTATGKELLVHELTHVVQQRDLQLSPQTPITVEPPATSHEDVAERMANASRRPPPPGQVLPQQAPEAWTGDTTTAEPAEVPQGLHAEMVTGRSHSSNSVAPILQRAMDDGPIDAGAIGGAPQPADPGQVAPERSGASGWAMIPKICSKRLDKPVVGALANHSYIDDTGGPGGDCRNPSMVGNYAIQSLTRGNFLIGCGAKTEMSDDPQSYTPNSKPCYPKAGVTDVHQCIRDAFAAYANPSYYSNVPFPPPWGPNSNTFAGTLARSCCADSTDSGLGWVPGWDHAPAGPCPTSPTGASSDSNSAGEQFGGGGGESGGGGSSSAY
jgi:hypothetical protein